MKSLQSVMCKQTCTAAHVKLFSLRQILLKIASGFEVGAGDPLAYGSLLLFMLVTSLKSPDRRQMSTNTWCKSLICLCLRRFPLR